MADWMELGSGPARSERVGCGIAELDDLLGPLVPGENIVWGVAPGCRDDVVGRVTSGAGVPLLTASLDELPAPSAESTTVWLTDLTQIGPSDLVRSSSRIGEAVRAVFGSAAICHWLLDREQLDSAEWLWSAQCVLSADSGEVIVHRADGRRAADSVIQTGHGEGNGASRRASIRAGNLGRGIRARRVELGWSQAELGRRVGVSASAISQMERGRLGLSLETAIEVADRLGIDFDELLRGPGTDHIVVEERPGIASERSPVRRESTANAVPRPPLRSTLVAPGGTLIPPVSASGRLTLLVGGGLLRVERAPQRALVRAGDIVDIDRAIGCAVTNLGAVPAVVFIS
ncbi:putative Xre family DNA-binding protein [Gordonia terrae NBRC 100016]|uniref:Xre family DNA-binding protein n=1 Tax=Gordonia terrae NBRC 100016 TaxID=1089454 RepID=A0ABQ0HD51_9ACTN|nr:putative Xre family DNA-binding protein [Gordonia terrae NBRC 100016]